MKNQNSNYKFINIEQQKILNSGILHREFKTRLIIKFKDLIKTLRSDQASYPKVDQHKCYLTEKRLRKIHTETSNTGLEAQNQSFLYLHF